MPGARALAFASRWFDPAIVASTFEPLIADWQRQWHDADRSQRPVIWLRGSAAFAIALIVTTPRLMATPIPSSIARRVLVRIAWFVGIAGTLMALPLVIDVRPWDLAIAGLLLAALPSGFVLALPFSVLPAVDIIHRHENTRVARVTAVKLATVATFVLVVAHGVLMPMANQQYRVMTFKRYADPALLERAAKYGRDVTPRPGMREASTVKLIRDAWQAGPATRYTQAGVIRRELSNRALFAVLPAFFVWLRWKTLATGNRWRPSAVVMTALTTVGFFAIYSSAINLESAWALRPGTGAWVAFIVGLLIGLTVQQRSTPGVVA